jgi:hypothetical protein
MSGMTAGGKQSSGTFLGLFFDFEDGADIFLQNIS